MKKLYLLLAPLIISGLLFSQCYYKSNISINQSVNASSQKLLPIIIIDAGHGGFDGGATTKDGYPEKHINLNISLYLKDFLQLLGFRTILTREKDVSLEDEGLSTIRQRKSSDLHNRMSLMEETENAVFISIHQNIYSEEKYDGMQVFYSPKLSEVSSVLAQSIQENTVELLQKDNTRQIKECGTGVYLIYNAVKPACLVECGFLSNVNEAKKLQTEGYQRQIAFCIAMGIQEYFYNKD